MGVWVTEPLVVAVAVALGVGDSVRVPVGVPELVGVADSVGELLSVRVTVNVRVSVPEMVFVAVGLPDGVGVCVTEDVCVVVGLAATTLQTGPTVLLPNTHGGQLMVAVLQRTVPSATPALTVTVKRMETNCPGGSVPMLTVTSDGLQFTTDPNVVLQDPPTTVVFGSGMSVTVTPVAPTPPSL